MECKINGVVLIGIADSGSDISLIREETTKELSIKIQGKYVSLIG